MNNFQIRNTELDSQNILQYRFHNLITHTHTHTFTYVSPYHTKNIALIKYHQFNQMQLLDKKLSIYVFRFLCRLVLHLSTLMGLSSGTVSRILEKMTNLLKLLIALSLEYQRTFLTVILILLKLFKTYLMGRIIIDRNAVVLYVMYIPTLLF